jgi:hypothetical protein
MAKMVSKVGILAGMIRIKQARAQSEMKKVNKGEERDTFITIFSTSYLLQDCFYM